MNNLFQNITWSQYLLTLALVLIIYYIAVLFLYYRKEVTERIRTFGKKGQEETFQDMEEADSTTGELMDDLESTVKEIGHSILVPGNSATKQELFVQLQQIVVNFGGLSRPGYRYALNNFIIEKAKENCGIDLSEQELEEAWEGLSR